MIIVESALILGYIYIVMETTTLANKHSIYESNIAFSSQNSFLLPSVIHGSNTLALKRRFWMDVKTRIATIKFRLYHCKFRWWHAIYKTNCSHVASKQQHASGTSLQWNRINFHICWYLRQNIRFLIFVNCVNRPG